DWFVASAIRRDLLDVHRRRKFVKRKMPWIDDAYPVGGREPYFPIWRFGHIRRVAAVTPKTPDPIGPVVNRGLNGARRITHPGVQFGTRNPHQAARHVQPEGMIVVFDRPLNGIAGQTVLAGKSRDAAVFHSA